MTPKQCAAARAALGWDRTTLATEADVSIETVRRLELGEAVNKGTLTLVERALSAAGIEFTRLHNGQEVGVMWKETAR